MVKPKPSPVCLRCGWSRLAHEDALARRIGSALWAAPPCGNYSPPAPAWRLLLARFLERIAR